MLLASMLNSSKLAQSFIVSGIAVSRLYLGQKKRKKTKARVEIPQKNWAKNPGSPEPQPRKGTQIADGVGYRLQLVVLQVQGVELRQGANLRRNRFQTAQRKMKFHEI